MALGLWGCTSVYHSYVYRTGKEAIADTTYAYGSVWVDKASKLKLVFRNTVDSLPMTYLKVFAENGIAQEHLFAFSVKP